MFTDPSPSSLPCQHSRLCSEEQVGDLQHLRHMSGAPRDGRTSLPAAALGGGVQSLPGPGGRENPHKTVSDISDKSAVPETSLTFCNSLERLSEHTRAATLRVMVLPGKGDMLKAAMGRS